MTKLILTDGETYRTRSGSLVRITAVKSPTPWKFSGSNGELYRSNGRSGFLFEGGIDLVAVSEKKMYNSAARAFDNAIKEMVAA